MKKRILLLLTLVLTLCLSSGLALAQSAKWVNPDTDLKNIKTVYINNDIKHGNKVYISPLDELTIKENLMDQAKLLKAFKITKNKAEADAEITVELLNNSVRNYTVPEKKEIVYEKVIITDKDGKESSISVPRTKVTPAYTVSSNYFSARYTVTLKDGTKAFEYIDNRDAAKYFANMFRRATKDFYRNLNKAAK